MKHTTLFLVTVSAAVTSISVPITVSATEPNVTVTGRLPESLDNPPASKELVAGQAKEPARQWSRGAYVSVQVNVDANGNNVVGDAANEPSMAIDPTDPTKLAIGWRHFDTIASNFRQAGNAYSQDGGQTWTFPGVLEPGQFRSDPVLAADTSGNFYYSSLSAFDSAEMFKSTDGGMTWSFPPVDAFGGDKQWITVDRTAGIGSGNVYQNWNVQFTCCPPNDFTRSMNGAASFQSPIPIPQPSLKWGTLDVGPNGDLYVVGATLGASGHLIARSTNAENPFQTPSFDSVDSVELGGVTSIGGIPNPAGLMGQVWIATDHSVGSTAGNVYILASVDPPGPDPLDVMFIRSIDNGVTWSAPVRVNDDPSTSAWQWFGTMSVAPNGRIDAIWNDTRKTGVANLSELYYTFSIDAGVTWSPNISVSPVFDSHLGWPQQDKMGDYFHMISDNGGANLAYAATFNGEQDVYFLRIPAFSADFVRGDATVDGVVSLPDVIHVLSVMSLPPPLPLQCPDAADTNDDGVVNLGDPLSVFTFLFQGGTTPVPWPDCGPDLIADSLLTCDYSECFAAEGPEDGGLSQSAEGPGYELTIQAPTEVSGIPGATVEFTATIQLTAATDQIVGFSLAANAADPARCTITQVNPSPALAALNGGSGPDLFGATVSESGAVVGSVFAIGLDVSIGAGDVPIDLAELTVRATIPASGCAPCTLQLIDATAGTPTIDNLVVTADGSSVTPTLVPDDVNTCADSSIPTVTQWGLAVMMILVLSAGTLVFGKPWRKTVGSERM